MRRKGFEHFPSGEGSTSVALVVETTYFVPSMNCACPCLVFVAAALPSDLFDRRSFWVREGGNGIRQARAYSSIGESSRLITGRFLVRSQVGPRLLISPMISHKSSLRSQRLVPGIPIEGLRRWVMGRQICRAILPLLCSVIPTLRAVVQRARRAAPIPNNFDKAPEIGAFLLALTAGATLTRLRLAYRSNRQT